MPNFKSARSFLKRARNRRQLKNQGLTTAAGEGQTEAYSLMPSIPNIMDADTTAEQSVRPDQANDQAVNADVTIDPPDPAAPVLSQDAEQMPSSTPAPSAPQDMAALSQQTGLHSQAPTAKPKVKTPAEQLQELFQEALDQYANRTKTNLRENPLATRLSSCDSVEAVTTILNEHISAFEDFRENGTGVQLMRRLKPIVSSLLALHLNETVGEGVGVVFGPGKAIIGAIGVLLEAVKRVSDSYDALLELFECVENFLFRLEVYTKIDLAAAMKDIVVKTLVEVISIFGLATEQVTSGRFQKYAKTLLGDMTIENALRRLNTLATLEDRTTAAESFWVIHGLVQNLKSLMMNEELSTLSIQKTLFELKESVAETQRNEMIKEYRRWLSPPDPSSNHNTAVKSHHEGTAVWFIEGEIMRNWMTNGSLMWINGKPGSGKTVLCSSIIEDIRRRCLLDPRYILVYFYCDFRDPAKQDVHGLLLHQLIRIASCSNACLAMLSNLYSMHNQGSERPTDDRLIRCLKEMLQALADHPVYIIIDALDECPNSGIPAPRKRMLTLAGDLITMHLPNLHICITSRPERDIAVVLKPLASQCIGIDAEDGQSRDIARYVCAAVESDSGYELWEGEEKALVIKELSAKANGMFRWAYCQLDVLRNCLSIRQALQDLPETLDETYMRILERLNRHNWKLTHRLLQCLTVCVRPLTARELVETLSVDIDSGSIPQLKTDWRRSNPELHIHILCSALVEINPDTKRVQFAHFSVQEYLLSSRLATEQEASLRQFHINGPLPCQYIPRNIG
ncbi:hypothetical protein CERSUDRAFT_124368 [Gelatoporia subvermispora B]|uniref:NACHT domain-containing protein n=1 Tax=Ceriporiopsis subvermispora (strain B) TaxID=914234 RepID=M2QHV3_CERS8|nr:hypothetical protein CERSUDRAFT_124368 [Gelatoporia subvermispora B]